MSLESAFKEYLVKHTGAVDLDVLPDSRFPKNKADYYLENKRSVFEVKTISSDRSEAFKPWLQKRVENSSEVKNGMPSVFGTVLFKGLYDSHSNKKLLNGQLDSLASRTLEGYVRSSKKQILDTKIALDCKDGDGFLVILNEDFEFYDTWFVYRIIQAILKRIELEQPHLKIDGVWYINESTKGKNEIDVVFIHESDELEDLTPNEILEDLSRGWANFRGY